ncbi:peptidylprolyl isomerase [Pseudomaricurvus sp.]|uniref:peptidylprolyl isomerase n=1 Tax=Pseudomaricurvus sp. TaxID=2004510 RepID=UPI003F6C6BB4
MMKTLVVSSLVFTFSCLTQAADNTAPEVELKTDLGTITLQLFPEKAPETVKNFLRYCNEGFYAGTIFHRVIPGFVAQAGGMTFDYVKKDTHEPVINESDNGLHNRRGTVAMARLPDPDSATSQFFINLNNNTHLDPTKDGPGYTVFAQVIDGMDVVQKITKEPQGKYRPQAPDLPIRILAVTVKP